MSTIVHHPDLIESGPARRDRLIAAAGGIAFCAWFVVAAVVYAGALPLPAFSDPDPDHLQYFADNATPLALHAWLSGIFWSLCFLGFSAGLSQQLATERRAMPWARLSFGGALLATAFGGLGVAIQTVATSVSGDAAAIVVPTLGRLLAVVDETLLYWGLAVYVGGGSIALARSSRGMPGLAWLGLADLVLLVVGAAWPLTGDDRGVVGALGLLGLLGAGAWTLWAAISMLRPGFAGREARPAPSVPAGPAAAGQPGA
jgi:hypothetical protein